ncbi:SH3 domain-containing YSC84-like protein 1 [Durusdinium trenchii]|uniref:SH3 domain-containing YSC84-like protein 1 n=1 Tax=Durusdinium trenchii TaxID=1381693 RepID=A0ABP0PWL0_9DINO
MAHGTRGGVAKPEGGAAAEEEEEAVLLAAMEAAEQAAGQEEGSVAEKAADMDNENGKENSGDAANGKSKNTTGSNAKGKGKRNSTKACAKTKKATAMAPAAGSKRGNKAGGPAQGKKKPKKLTPAEQKEKVHAYMVQQCRPYNSTKVFENLHKSIPHPAIKSVLQELVAQGAVTEKADGRAALFWIKQEASALPEAERKKELADAQQAVTALREVLRNTECQLQQAKAAAATLAAEPTDGSLSETVGALKTKVDALEAEVAAVSGRIADCGQEHEPEDLKSEKKYFGDTAKTLRCCVSDVVNGMVDCDPSATMASLIEDAQLEIDADADSHAGLRAMRWK